jgi:hypothetical protein
MPRYCVILYIKNKSIDWGDFKMLSGILSIIIMIAIYGVVVIDYRQQCALKSRNEKYMLNRESVFNLNKRTA